MSEPNTFWGVSASHVLFLRSTHGIDIEPGGVNIHLDAFSEPAPELQPVNTADLRPGRPGKLEEKEHKLEAEARE